MKNHLFILLLAIFFISCKNEVKPEDDNSYPRAVVGTNTNGNYEISDLSVIKKNWEMQISEKLDGAVVNLEVFEIVKGTTVGDAAQEFYILTARNDAGNINSSALLELRGDKFYFEKEPRPDSEDVYLNIVCSGECNEGCLPVVKSVNGSMFLVCSDCADCMKIENEMKKQ